MKLLDLISENRRNPDLNSQKMGHSAVVDYLSSITTDELVNYGVTLTSVPKLGINPQSEFETPLAICFYPAAYYLEKKRNGKSMEYADSAAYIQVIKLSGNVVIFDQRDDIFETGVELLLSHAEEIASVANTSVDEIINNIQQYKLSAERRARIKTPGGYFWYVLYMLSNNFQMHGSKKRSMKIAQRMPVLWNKILRIIGIDIVVDNGLGILHKHEPWQGMAFNPSAVTAVKVFPRTKTGIEKGTELSAWERMAESKVTGYVNYANMAIPLIIKNAKSADMYEDAASRVASRLYMCLDSEPDLLLNMSYDTLTAIAGAFTYVGKHSRNKMLLAWIRANWEAETTHRNLRATLESYIKSEGDVPSSVIAKLSAIYHPFIQLYKNPVLRIGNPEEADIDEVERMLKSIQ